MSYLLVFNGSKTVTFCLAKYLVRKVSLALVLNYLLGFKINTLTLLKITATLKRMSINIIFSSHEIV